MTTVAVNMILANYLEPYLEFALTSLCWVDEFVIVNTGDDSNPNLNVVLHIANKYGKQIKMLKYTRDGLFDFADARNFAIDHTESDYIIKLDADEVFYDSFQDTVRRLDYTADIYVAEFYHFMIDVFHYQELVPREILFKNGLRYERAVHEYLIGESLKRRHLPDKYCHFGYAQPQPNIFRKWLLYADIEGEPNRHITEDPNHILDNRLSVCKRFDIDYPEVIAEYVKTASRVVRASIVDDCEGS